VDDCQCDANEKQTKTLFFPIHVSFLFAKEIKKSITVNGPMTKRRC
jgi:hypothetical protein